MPDRALVNCSYCGGSGQMLGTYGDIECPECGGQGQWEDESLADLRKGELGLTEVHPDPMRRVA